LIFLSSAFLRPPALKTDRGKERENGNDRLSFLKLLCSLCSTITVAFPSSLARRAYLVGGKDAMRQRVPEIEISSSCERYVKGYLVTSRECTHHRNDSLSFAFFVKDQSGKPWRPLCGRFSPEAVINQTYPPHPFPSSSTPLTRSRVQPWLFCHQRAAPLEHPPRPCPRPPFPPEPQNPHRPSQSKLRAMGPTHHFQRGLVHERPGVGSIGVRPLH
jgi:hypothetical protein